jgi:2-methylisocitrate lyase-like PEP mutase family enzyme
MEPRAAFRDLHESGCFVIPNPWDVGSAKYLEHLGFPAIATTSSGFAWSTGRADYGIDRDDALAHFAAIAEGVGIPVNADFENGFADDPADVARNVALCTATGIAGLSIEDSTGRADDPLYDLDLAVERIAAARAAIDAIDPSVVLTGRAEGFLRGAREIDAACTRLAAYSDAGADCLYAPGIRNADQVRAVVEAVAPKPVNVLVAAPGRFTVAELAELGVRRISVGGALARVAWGAFMRAATDIRESGTFETLGDAAAGGDLQGLFTPE